MAVGRQQSEHLDFFRQQRSRRQRSWLLFGLFLLVVLAHLVVTLGVALFVMWLTGGIYAWVIVAIVIWILGSFLFGSMIEYRRLKAGGRAVARQVGAVRLFIDQSYDALPSSKGGHQEAATSKVRFSTWQIAVKNERDFPPVYRRYVETAQQMAIAAGIPLPLLYILPSELGINSFVAGRHPKDTVLVVTEGALEKLDDEALYGLIAHEMSHILQGDAQFNLQLLVLLAGLQLLYDWSDPLSASTTANYSPNQPLPNQRDIDAAARKTELETAQFSTQSEWISYWQARSVPQLRASALDFSAAESSSLQLGKAVLHGLSFSSMACAQLIKRSFNRERELLADATSIQLTRSPAVLATLKAIAKDPIGSRLTATADIHGLSHFFFASSGADLGDHSWFATHPSLMTRMQAIDSVESQKFSLQKQRAQQKNRQQIKAIYEQRRLGDWGEILAQASTNSLSKNNPNSDVNQNDEKALTFKPNPEVVVNGRLQIDAFSKPYPKTVDPSAAPLDIELDKDRPVSLKDINHIGLPQNILDHLHHPLGTIAIVEMVMLCHQNRPIQLDDNYGLADIWDNRSQANGSILAHKLDKNLLIRIARLDRRLDSALIASAVGQLQKMDISSKNVANLYQASLESHSHDDAERYLSQKKAHDMAQRYKTGLLKLVQQQLSMPLTCDVAAWLESPPTNKPISVAENDNSMLPLWQALHLSTFHQALIQALAVSDDINNVLQSAIEDILHQLDPSDEVLARLQAFEQTMVILFAFALSKQLPASANALKQALPDKIEAFRRYLRLMSVSIDQIETAKLQWLLLVAAKLNSSQLLAVICFPSFCQIPVEIAYNNLSSWLSTLHTLMLHDTVITQNEFDCLMLLALRWVGRAELF